MTHVVISDGLDIQKNATVFEYTNSNPLAVRLTDEDGNYVAPGGGGGGGLTDAELRASPVPVSGTFWQATQPISAASLPLPTGAATEATLVTLLTTSAFQARINTLGQKTMANSTPVTLASDQSALPVTDNGGSLTVDGTVTANAGTGTFTTKETRAATGTASNVSGSATSVTLLASNANRLGATFYNDSTAILYLKCGATASTTSFTVKLFAEDFYELPANYTGIVDGIWASATGAARVTEFT